MKNITLSADEELIDRARDAARARNTSLNSLFRDWLREIGGQKNRQKEIDDLMKRLSYAKSHGPYTRDEMNER